MRIAALSDLHIGATERTDTFGHLEDAFLRWLDRLERSHDHIVLLGDIYQTDHGLLPGKDTARRLLDRARARLDALTRRTAEPQYLWVHGNHDPVTAEVLGAERQIILGPPGQRALFTHGDLFDPVIRAIPRLSALGTWFAGRTRAAGLRRLAEHLEDKDVEVKAGRHTGEGGPYAEGAAALMREHDVQIVVMGHTHIPARLTLPGGTLANTGTCSRGRFMGVSVDTGTGEVRHLGEDQNIPSST